METTGTTLREQQNYTTYQIRLEKRDQNLKGTNVSGQPFLKSGDNDEKKQTSTVKEHARYFKQPN